MMRTGIYTTVVFALTFGLCAPAKASIVTSMTLRELVDQADDIVVAKVVSVTAAWDGAHRHILSTVEADVEEIWKGNTDTRHVTVVQPGGTVGDIEMTVYGMPTFSVAERSLLFLKRAGQRRVVLGMSQGKRPVRWDSSVRQWLVQGHDGRDTLEVAGDGSLRTPTSSPAVALQDMRAKIRALASER
jgi:hypothetical protein